jgi:hypothetical protein
VTHLEPRDTTAAFALELRRWSSGLRDVPYGVPFLPAQQAEAKAPERNSINVNVRCGSHRHRVGGRDQRGLAHRPVSATLSPETGAEDE